MENKTLKTMYAYSNGTVNVMTYDGSNVTGKLKPMVYTVNYSDLAGYFLKIEKDRFSIPNKIFGKFTYKSEKIINTYNNREKSTGILLTGLKGAGKTLLAKIISNKMIDSGLPVITINTPFSNEQFQSFLSSLGECVVLFDEFAKVYNSRGDDAQETLLSMFDGTMSTKRMYILTENYASRLSNFFIGRPGRILYHLKYDKLDKSVIREYCQYKNVDNNFIVELETAYRKISTFSFDVMESIVEEYIRYGESIETILNDLNVEVRNLGNSYFEILKMVSVYNRDVIIPLNTKSKKVTDLVANEDMSINLENYIDIHKLTLTQPGVKEELPAKDDEKYDDSVRNNEIVRMYNILIERSNWTEQYQVFNGTVDFEIVDDELAEINTDNDTYTYINDSFIVVFKRHIEKFDFEYKL